LPAFGSEPNLLERLRVALRRIVLRDKRMPTGWSHQRELAAEAARTTASKSTVPLYVLVEARGDRSEAGRSARLAQKLVHRTATQVRVLQAGEAASVRDLSPALQEEIVGFLRRR
jgi:phosphoribosylformimino-5-aminoimidazole carboxamide ribonucleotide (ProFAR) isomerase